MANNNQFQIGKYFISVHYKFVHDKSLFSNLFNLWNHFETREVYSEF